MLNEDQTPNQDGIQNPNPGEGTADAGTTAKDKINAEPDKTAELMAKLKASQDEAIRLRKAHDELQNSWEKVTPVLKILNERPDLMQQIDDIYSGNSTSPVPAAQMQVNEALLEKKVAEKIAPLAAEIDFDRKQRVDRAFTDFVKRHPDAPQVWDKIERNLAAMKAAGYPLEEGLENSYFLAKKDEAIKQGKKEMALEYYQRDMAAVSGGSAAGSGSTDSSLSPEEEKVAKELGLKADDYAGAKLK